LKKKKIWWTNVDTIGLNVGPLPEAAFLFPVKPGGEKSKLKLRKTGMSRRGVSAKSKKKYPGRTAGCREIPGENGCKGTFGGSPEICRMCESPEIAGMRRDRAEQVKDW